MTPQEARKLYTYLDSGKIYMNHAGISPISTYVKKRLDEYIYVRTDTEIDSFFEFLPTFNSARQRLASLLNTASDRIAFLDCVSNGLNLLAQSLDWKEGDRIILNDIEFPSNIYPFLNLKSKGVEIDFVKSVDGKIEVEQIEKLITPRTKLLSISQVQFLSGYRADLNTIGEICDKNNVIFCVDVIQGAGVRKIDIKESKIDYVAGGSHKWLMGLQGTGYIYVSEELQAKMNPAYVGWLSVDDDWSLLDYKLELKESALRFENGTKSLIGVTALEASLDLMNQIGFDTIENQILSNTEYFINKLDEIGLNPIMKGVKSDSLAGIVSFKHEKADELFNSLGDKKIVCAPREGMIRFSPHYYNTKEEIDVVVKELKIIIKN